MAIPKRVRERLTQNVRKFVPIIEQQLGRDVSEADTVTLVKDFLAEALGFDKYTELTGEHAIRGTYCDLAVKLEGKLQLLVEVKAIGTDLDEKHVKQAVDYAANEGVEWVILTNARAWRLYHVIFAKPIDKQLITTMDLRTIDMRKEADLEQLYVFTKEGFGKGAHVELKDMQDATSRHVIGALLVENESVLSMIRRELRRVVETTVDEKDIKRVLMEEIIKRDVMNGQDWKDAVKKVNRREGKALRKRRTRKPRIEATASSPTPAAEPKVTDRQAARQHGSEPQQGAL